MYADILVPVDGSEASMDAVSHAAALADVHEATIHVVYVVQPQAGVESAGVDVVGALEDVGERAIEDADARVAEAGLDSIESSILEGTPHRQILDYAEANGIDLIVMGTHGRTGLGRLLLGSVTEKIVRAASVPVLTVRPPTDEAE
jgi:nucleotide-binding universal stress UspA family protein